MYFHNIERLQVLSYSREATGIFVKKRDNTVFITKRDSTSFHKKDTLCRTAG